MPKISLPGKVFENEFDKYYLFDYYQEFLRNNFFQKMNRVESTLKSDKIKIDLIDINLVYNFYWNSNISFMKFLNLTKVRYENEVNFLESYLHEFYIKGETNNWEIYGFETDEILILGVSKQIQKVIEENLIPYNYKTAKSKLEEISWIFGDDKLKKEKFVRQMNELYNFY